MAAQTGTGYSNLQKIIQANQGDQLGNAVQGGVQKGIAGLQSNIGQQQQQFSNDVNNANLGTQANQQYASGVINSIVNPALTPPPANVNAPQAQAAPTPGMQQTPQVAGTTTPPTGQESAFSMPQVKSVAPTAPPAQTTGPATAPAPTPAAATAQAQQSAPGSFGFSNPTSGANQTSAATNTPNAGDLSKFAQFLQGKYSGPQQLNNYNKLLSQGQNLQELGKNVGTTGGLQNLLQQFVGGNGYNQGEQTLDTLLLGQNQPQLQNIARSTQNAANLPAQAEAQAEAQAQQAATGNQAFSQNIKNQIQAAQNPILQNIQSNIGNLNSQNTAYENNVQQIQNLLQNPDLSSSAKVGGLQQRGISPTIGGKTDQTQAQAAIDLAKQNGLVSDDQYSTLTKLIPQIIASGQDVKSVLNQAFTNTQPDQYSLQQGATAQQAAQLNALQQLGGQTPQFQTYGGAQPASAAFDASKLPALNAPAPVQPNYLPPGTFLTGNGTVLPLTELGTYNPGFYTSNGGGSIYADYSNGTRFGGSGGIAQVNRGDTNANINSGLQIDPSMYKPGGYFYNPTPTPTTPKGMADGGEVKQSYSVFDNLSKPSDSYFCTELYKRGLLDNKQITQMAKFFLTAIFYRPRMCLFYATHGEYITKVANNHNFQWIEIKDRLSTNVISFMNEGKKEQAFDSYSHAIKLLCIRYNETRFLWNDANIHDTFFDFIKCFPKILCSKTFKVAIKTYVRSLFRSKK